MKITTTLLLSLLLMTGGKKKEPITSNNIDNRLVKVEDRLYANKYETTNGEYREFLDWIKTHKSEDLKKFEIRHNGWDDLHGSEYSAQYFNNRGFDNYPVVNITQEAAKAFCAWLTDQYNESADRKKKFTKVKFRLPTEKEWLGMALHNSKRPIKYPWGGPYLQNKKGCHLANYRRVGNGTIKMDINDPTTVSIEPWEDRQGKKRYGNEVLASPVTSFTPTGAGLHNLAGNAAEMLAEEGRTKGGSWGSTGYYLQIGAEDEFKGFVTSPFVGFRYVMEVIEK